MGEHFQDIYFVHAAKWFDHSRIREATSVPGELLNWRNNAELGPSNWNVCVRVEYGLVDGNWPLKEANDFYPIGQVSYFVCFYFRCLGEQARRAWRVLRTWILNTCLPLFPSLLPSLVPWGEGGRECGQGGWVCGHGRAIANLNQRDLWFSSGHRAGTYLGVVQDHLLLQKRELCGPFGLVWSLWGPPTESISKLGFFVLSAFLGFRLFLLKPKRKKRKEKSGWLINYSWTSFGSFEVSIPTSSPLLPPFSQGLLQLAYKMLKVRNSDSILLAYQRQEGDCV